MNLSTFNVISNYYSRSFLLFSCRGKGLRRRTGYFFFPLFNRKAFYFRLPYAMISVSKKKRNINSTVWFQTSISKTSFLFIVPVYSNYIVFF